MKFIKAVQYALDHLEAIKRDIRYYDKSQREGGLRYGSIAVVVELKGDGRFTHHVKGMSLELAQMALDPYTVIIASVTRGYDDDNTEVFDRELQQLEDELQERLDLECAIERKLSVMEG